MLLGRKAWAARLLAAVDRGQIAAKEISVDQLRLVALHDDRQLDALVKKHWGSIQGGTPEERLAEMRRINNDLRAGRGDPAAGKAAVHASIAAPAIGCSAKATRSGPS